MGREVCGSQNITEIKEVEKPEGKRPVRRTRCRWEDNVNMDLK
jgi:hypothetical protein